MTREEVVRNRQSIAFTVCSYCEKLIKSGRDVQPDPLYGDEQRVSHGVCPACLQEQLAKINKRENPAERFAGVTKVLNK